MIMPLMTVARYNYKVFSSMERRQRSVCGTTISLVSLTRKPATPRDAPRTQQLSRQSNSKWLHSNALRRRQLANYLIKSVLASRFLLFLSWPHDAPIAQFSFPSAAASHNLTSSPDVIYSPVNGKKLHIIKIFTLQATDRSGGKKRSASSYSGKQIASVQLAIS